jgi:hypothetical protein
LLQAMTAFSRRGGIGFSLSRIHYSLWKPLE